MVAEIMTRGTTKHRRNWLPAAITVALCAILWLALSALKAVAGQNIALVVSAFVIAAAIIAAICIRPGRRQR